MTRTPWFDEVGIEYAAAFAELEEARRSFRAQRDAILDRIREVLRAEEGVTREPAKEADLTLAFYEPGPWHEARQRRGKRGNEGFAIGIHATEEGPIVFQAHVFFQGYQAVRGLEPKALKSGTYAHVERVIIPITPQTSYALFEDNARQVVAAHRRWSADIAARYQRIQVATDDEA